MHSSTPKARWAPLFLLWGLVLAPDSTGQPLPCNREHMVPNDFVYLETDDHDPERSLQFCNPYSKTYLVSFRSQDGTATSEDYQLVFGQDPRRIDPGESSSLPIRLYSQFPGWYWPEAFEILARVVAYDSWSTPLPGSSGEKVDTRLAPYPLHGFDYYVDRAFSDGSGFQAVGLTSVEYFDLIIEWRDAGTGVVDRLDQKRIYIFDENRPPILAIRGTEREGVEALGDVLTDLDPEGIGWGQFHAVREAVASWLQDAARPRQNFAYSIGPHVTGHSLGGALTQWIAADYTGAGGYLGQVVTFNAPGIPRRNFFGYGVGQFNPGNASSVTHYVTAGDLVSLAGDDYLPGGRYQLINWVKSSYKGLADLADGSAILGLIGEKHSVPVVTAQIFEDGRMRPDDRGFWVKSYYDGVARLGDDYFSYLIDPLDPDPRDHDQDYWALLVAISTKQVKDLGGMERGLAARMVYRRDVEAVRRRLGVFLLGTKLVMSEAIRRAMDAAGLWNPFVWRAIDRMTRKRVGEERSRKASSGSLPAAGGIDRPVDFWEAIGFWPPEAWTASTAWGEHAWAVMSEDWGPEQWSATASPQFPWAETVHWDEEAWKDVEAIAKRIKGRVWNDRDADGQANESSGRAGAFVYLDRIRNSSFDAGEPHAVTGSDGTYTLFVDGVASGSYYVRQELDGESGYQISFPPAGEHRVDIDGDPNQLIAPIDFGNFCTGGDCERILVPPSCETLVVNQHMVIVKCKDLGPRGKIANYETHDDHRVQFDTWTPKDRYACAVVGMAATGGDIDEDRRWGDLVSAFAHTRAGYDNWHIAAQFKTEIPDINSNDYPKPVDWENWDVDLLCIDSDLVSTAGPEPGKPVFFQKLTDRGDAVDEDTGIRFQDYACGLGGFAARAGSDGRVDINENDAGDIIQAYLYRKTGTWHVKADFRTHHESESWDLDLVCVSRDWASLDGPQPGKRVFFKEFRSLGSRVHADSAVSSRDYGCGVVGLGARHGDIDEHPSVSTSPFRRSSSRELLVANLYDHDGRWHLRADFRTHHDSESWDVNILCVAKDGVGLPWNQSHLEAGLGSCMTNLHQCQVLPRESIDLLGEVTLRGGGILGSEVGKRCASLQAVEVYVDDRDPQSGKPRWSWPDLCLDDGDRLVMEAGRTYDFRSASVASGAAKPFRLEAVPNAPPVITSAEAKEFPVPLGPGIEVSWWTPPKFAGPLYQVHYSKDGTNWLNGGLVSTNSFDHHGQSHHGPYRFALPSRERFLYRVRRVAVTHAPITDWSAVRSATVQRYGDDNQPPVIHPIDLQRIPALETLWLSVTAEDPDGDGLSLEMIRAPVGAVFTSQSGSGTVTGELVWLPGANRLGPHEVELRATDSYDGATATRTVELLVCNGSNCGNGGGGGSPRIIKVDAFRESPTEVVIQWSTDVPATSQVQYGYSHFLGSETPVNSNLEKDHLVRITGLDANTILFYRVLSRDASGKLVQSAVLTVNGGGF